jgi:hypothetical protein
MLTGDFFITPHAVRQFQNRLAPHLSYEQALGVIIRELREAGEWHPTENGKANYVRTSGEWRFRAVIAEGEGDAKPAVITILRGGKSKKRRNQSGSKHCGMLNKEVENEGMDDTESML